MANLKELSWEKVLRHQMEPAGSFPGEGGTRILHRHGGEWHEEAVRPFFARVDGFLSVLCEERDGGIYPFILGGSSAASGNGAAGRDARERFAREFSARW